MSAIPTSTSTKVVSGALHRVRRGRRKAFAPTAAPDPERKPARVAVMLALAHKIRQAIDQGEIRDQGDAARRLGLTRARITQLLDLTFLAPVLQERILFLQAIRGVQPATERQLRLATRISSWSSQQTLVVSQGSRPR